MKAIALTRVSTEAQAGEDRGGLQGQRAEIVRIAEAHGLDIVEWVQLQGVSGAAVLADSRFAAMLDALRTRRVGAIVVAEFSRLMRPENLADYAILEAFRQAGAKLYTPEGSRDLGEFTGRVLSLFQGEMAAEERRKIRERTQRGKEVLRRAGRHVSGPNALPFGVAYRNEREGPGMVRPVWEYVWPQAGIVKEAFERVLSGERNFAEIARQLGLDRSAVRRMLLNPIYMGLRRIDQHKVDGKDRSRAPEDVIEVRVLDTPLVDPDDFARVQEILADRPAAPRWDAGPCVYRGFLRCGACGHPMRVNHAGRWGWHYRCTGKARKGTGCKVGSIVQRAVDSAADDVMTSRIADPDQLSLLLQAALERPEARRMAEADPQALAERISSLRAERGRVLTSYERGLRELSETESRVRAIDREIRGLEHQSQRAPGERSDPLVVARQLAETFVGWKFLSRKQKRKILVPTLRSVHVLRAGRGKAAIKAMELVIPEAGVDLSQTGSVHGRRS